jgi:fibronectin type 3 domain-containing protein
VWHTLLALLLLTTQTKGDVAVDITGGLAPQAQIGDRVTFTCSVTDQGAHTVSWWFINHNLQISANEKRITSDIKYVIHHPLGDHGEWQLQISGLTAADAGHYMCKVDGTIISKTLTLTITDAPAKPIPSTVPAVNYTDCCVKEQVSTACLPVCNPRHVPDNFDVSLCASDLLKLLKCGADGRNHAPCCRRNFVNDHCLGFCVNDPPASIDASYAICLNKSIEIILCMDEGQITLPGPPAAVVATVESASKIILSWSPPLENADKVTGYRVYHLSPKRATYTGSQVITGTTYPLTNLTPISKYQMYVVAIGSHGSSLPSVIISAMTKSDTSITPETKLLSECCAHRGVSEKCQGLLCSGRPSADAQDSSIFQCLSELDPVFECIAFERNHTSCCVLSGVPEQCLTLCAGKAPTTYNALTCVTRWMPTINSCFMEGLEKIPGPPINFHIESVQNDSAMVQWDAPTMNRDKVTGYEVLYRKLATSMFTRKQTNKTEYTLLGLDPSTKYDVEVLSMSNSGMSLPTPEAIFLTYYDGNQVQPDTTPQPPSITPIPPYDEEACCRQNNVTNACMMMCDYEADFSSMDYGTLLSCEGFIATALMCGASGRNHTDCCVERGVVDLCRPFCAFGKKDAEEFQFSVEHVTCVPHLPSIIQCFQDGLVGVSPAWPESVRVLSYTTNTISIGWNKPNHIGAGVTHYLVQYAASGPEQIWKEVRVVGQMNYILQNLKEGTYYNIKVMAANANATSLPSPIISRRTLTGVPEPSPLVPAYNFTSPGDITECCKKEGVSQECIGGCTGTSIINSHVCSSQLDKLFTCSADGRDHRACCSRSNVPEPCLPYCMGRNTPPSIVGVLCPPFTQVIITCFHEGYDTLPSAPTLLRLEEITARSLKFSFDKPEKNGDNVLYDLYWREELVVTGDGLWQLGMKDIFKLMENVTSPVEIRNLEPIRQYEVFVVAKNKHGSSQPTSTLKVLTLTENRPSIRVVQQPPGTYVREKSPVTLTCMAGGEPFPTIYWMDKNNERTDKTVLSFQSISRQAGGMYTCVADNGQGPNGITSKSIYVKVQYQPSARAKENMVLVEPDKGLSVLLVCFFQGYPEPDKIIWMKDNQAVPVNDRGSHYKAWTRDNEDSSVLEAVLEINAVSSMPNDYGNYVCQGTNDYGSERATIILAKPQDHPDITIPPDRQIPNVPNVTACCIQKKVTDMCMPACTFDIDITILANLPNPLACALDLPHFIECAADGRNHTKCCQNSNIPAECVPMCSGYIPIIHVGLIQCLERVGEIMDCMEMGHDNIPSQPQKLSGQLTDHGYIQLNWDPPAKNADMVQGYTVSYYSHSAGQQEWNVRASATSQLLSGIHGNTRYTITAMATNHHGHSQVSNTITITTVELMPSEPQNLQGELISDVYIRLTWDMPKENSGYVTKYNIYYRGQGQKQYNNVTTVDATPSYRLNDMMPDTKYDIYVTSISSHSESRGSNVIVMQTGIPPTKEKQGGKHDVGVALALFFTILVILTVTAIVAFWYLKVRKSGPHFKESVAFENPGYTTTAEGRVSGLPSYSDPNMQPSNGHLVGTKSASIMREDSDQGYATLSETNGHITKDKSLDSHPTLDLNNGNVVDKDDIALSFENPGLGNSRI